MDKIIYGADTETLFGKPLTLQFYSEHDDCEDIYFVGENTAFEKLLDWCGQRRRNVEHVVYVHNLDFDAIEFLWRKDFHKAMASPGGEFKFTHDKWTIAGCYGAPTFFRISNGHNITVTFVDSFSFFKASLAQAADLFCPILPKLKRPEGLGEKKFTKRDTEFCEYALRDAVVAFHMGCAIERVHQQFDIRQTVSIADMAAKIFRHRFVYETIPLCPGDLIDASLYSYHGGKNNLAAAPGWYSGVSSLDISSAYPHAMSHLPSFTRSDLYKPFGVKRLNLRQKIPTIPDHGIYLVSGNVESCDWPCVFNHAFKPIRSGAFQDIWIAGYELNEAIRSGELRPSSIVGTYYDSEKDKAPSSFNHFVTEFYKLKEREPDKVMRTFYKLILNSLYGKFIQTRKKSKVHTYDVDNESISDSCDLVAGGLFHPFIASLITAHTRARIHVLEHKYSALHTATDGIFTTKRIPSSIKSKALALGDLTHEATGDLMLARNKLYILYGEKGFPSKAFKGKTITKYAKHGFQGSVFELEKMMANNRRKYTVTKPNRLKESVKRGLVPNLFTERPMVLKVPPLKVQK